ncbi:SIMPL domain-containing protein [Tenacibaculum ovolyticum]|uniref:SIMPL domain-containing protein n=1 Tax=Tenacibaculum ovolyticum TaxID=104270 RepID=UPI0007EDC3CE|nr:SIMPL domain-containing protein [Tenacibaculum ovolyticum]WBX75966.1 SIMPL domain-containing protein [Tenacibaculum ovolyticum]
MKAVQIIIILFLSSTIFGQTIKDNTPFIEVTGKVELEISPDEIYLDISLKESIKNGKKTTLDKLEDCLKEELEIIGIPKECLFVSDINSVIAKTGWWTKEILSTGKYSLKITSPKKLKEAFKIFEKLKITDVRITKATHSKLDFYKKKNRIAAIKAAKEKADYLLNAINANTGKPLKVNETNHDLQNFAQLNYVNNSPNRYESSISKSYNKGIVQFENIKLTSSIYVVFEIK